MHIWGKLTMLKINNIHVAYKGVEVIHDVSFGVESGRFTVLIGANGAGKSTVIKSITGLHHASRGEILFDGKNIISEKPHKIAAMGIALCPEGRQLFPDMPVWENMEMGAYTRNNKAEIKADMDMVFDLFPRLAERKNQKARTLSGGEQEMLAIARALMAKPKLLILDEPSWGLAPLMVKEVMNMVKTINRETGMTILLVEQNANAALENADYAYVLDIGKIAIQGTPEQLLADSKVKEIYLGGN